MILVTCTACGRKYKFPDDARGRKTRCKACTGPIKIAEPEDSAKLRKRSREQQPVVEGQLEYYVKVANRVRGPFSLTRLQQLARSGKLLPNFMVSADRQHWRKASSLDVIFQLKSADAPQNPSAGITDRVNEQTPENPAPDSVGFLDFALDDVEDTSVLVCRSCGTEADHDAEECATCGMVPATGRPPKNPDAELTSHELECKYGFAKGSKLYRQLHPAEFEHIRNSGRGNSSDENEQSSNLRKRRQTKKGQKGKDTTSPRNRFGEFLTNAFCFFLALGIVSIVRALSDRPPFTEIAHLLADESRILPLTIGLSVGIRICFPVVQMLLLEMASVLLLPIALLLVPIGLLILPFWGLYQLARKWKTKQEN